MYNCSGYWVDELGSMMNGLWTGEWIVVQKALAEGKCADVTFKIGPEERSDNGALRRDQRYET